MYTLDRFWFNDTQRFTSAIFDGSDFVREVDSELIYLNHLYGRSIQNSVIHCFDKENAWCALDSYHCLHGPSKRVKPSVIGEPWSMTRFCRHLDSPTIHIRLGPARINRKERSVEREGATQLHHAITGSTIQNSHTGTPCMVA